MAMTFFSLDLALLRARHATSAHGQKAVTQEYH